MSQAVRKGRQLVLSGQVALDESGEVVGEGDAAAQCQQIFRNIERLLGKGGDTDKEIYGIRRLAAADDPAAVADADLGLHFDLTVPFARYVLENAGHRSAPR